VSSPPRPALLIAAHGTASAPGLATTRAITAAVASRLPDVTVSLCFLDVATPSLASALEMIDGPVVVVPLVLSSGYHVRTDFPAVVAGRADVRVTPHLGPAPALADVLAARLREAASGRQAASTAMVAIGSSREEARVEVAAMAALLGERVGRPVQVVPLLGDVRGALSDMPRPVEVASYLLAEGTFSGSLDEAVEGLGWAAAPIGADPAVADLVVARFQSHP